MKKAERKDSYSHILKYTGLFGGVQGLSILVGVIRNKLIAILLGPGGMGLSSLFSSTIKLVSDSTNFGLATSAVKNMSEEYDGNDDANVRHAVDMIRYWSILTAIFGTLVCIVMSPLLSRFTFSWDGHTLHFLLLSPVIALTAITGGEMAILKGTRQMRHLAVISVYSMIASLFISVSIYYFYGISGIVPSLVLLALSQMLITTAYTWRLYPFHWNFNRSLFDEGKTMIRLGMAFVLAGMLGSGADFLIRSYLNNVAQMDAVGLYNAGYVMTMTYVGMVFSAMETDYFPRLSGVNHMGMTFNVTVNRQIEVMILLVSPLLVAFMILLPILLPLLYSGKFMPVLGMMQILVVAMYFRALKLPVEYIPLAKGDSRSFLLMEAVYDVSVLLLVMLGFDKMGLSGAGLGITVASFIGLVFDFVYAHWRYRYRPSANVILYASLQLPVGLIAYFLTLGPVSAFYWVVGALLFVVSLVASLAILKSKTHLWEAITGKIKTKFHLK